MTSLARLFIVVSAVFAVTAPTARAGTYEVTSCKSAAGNANFAWSLVQSGDATKLQAGDACDGPGEFGGLWVADALGSGISSNGDVSGYWSFTAPPTTRITALTYLRYLRTFSDEDWRSQTRTASGASLESCQVSIDVDPCRRGTVGGQTQSFENLSTSRLEVGVECATGSASLFCINGTGDFHSAQATIYDATVTVTDPLAPSIGALTGGLVGGGWLRGTQTVQGTASDATGIKELNLLRNGAVVRTDPGDCDYRYRAPCALSGTGATSSWSAIDTAALSDGEHTFRAVARDAASNLAEGTEATVKVDNTAPVEPLAPTAQGGTWTAQPARSISWTLPGGQVSPIEGAQVRLCRDGTAVCTTPGATTTSSSFSLPGEGLFNAFVELIDAAGNVGSSVPIALGYDATAPPAPVLGTVTSTGGDGYEVVADTSNDPGPAPIRGLVGEACPVDGGACEVFSAEGVPPTRAALALPSAGRWTVAVRSIDAAGNTSESAMTTYDVESPAASPTPLPSPTSSPLPTASPDPTTTPPTSRTARLKLTRALLSRRLVVVRGVVSRAAAGTVSVRVRTRGRTVRRSVKVKAGAFTARVRLARKQRGARRVKLAVRYGGDRDYSPQSLTMTLRR